MFLQIGATLIFWLSCDGRTPPAVRRDILRRTISPSSFFISGPHKDRIIFAPAIFRLSRSLQSYNIQKAADPARLALWHHEPIARISTDYFIAFPCMHIVQPIIVLWFLRRWAANRHSLAAYDLLLVCRNTHARNALCDHIVCRLACGRACHRDTAGSFLRTPTHTSVLPTVK